MRDLQSTLRRTSSHLRVTCDIFVRGEAHYLAEQAGYKIWHDVERGKTPV